MKKTKIEWCDATINPVVGCTYGCPYCYAKKINERFNFVKDFKKPQFFPDRLNNLKAKLPQRIFMNSMSDIADWETEVFSKVYQSILSNSQHKYLFLTKRPEKLFFTVLKSNVWYGVTVTNRDDVHRIIALQLAPVKKRFISFEPLHDFIGVDGFLFNIDWVIIGAETGNSANKIIPKISWINNIVYVAKHLGIPVFMKDSLIPILGESNLLREFPEELNEFTTKK